MKRALLGVALFAVALLATPAFAAAKTKVLIDAPKPVATELTKALKAKHGTGSAQLADEPTAGDVKNACLEHAAVAIITARQVGSLMNFMVLNCSDGSPLTTFKITWGKKPPKVFPKPDVAVLMQAIAEARPATKAAKPPPAAEEKPAPAAEQKPAPVAEKPPEESGRRKKREEPTAPPPPPKQEPAQEAKPEVVEEDTSPRPQALRLGLGFKVFSRQFGYTDDLFNRLSTYKLPFGPAIAVDVDLYPGAFVSKGVIANIGAMVYFDYALGIASKAADGTKYGTSAFNLKLALTYRLAVGPLTVNPFVGYAMQQYSITSNTGMKPNIPNVGYGGLRGGVQVKVKIFGPVSVQASFAGDLLLSSGEISTYFPRLKANGLDAQFAIPVQIIEHVEVKLQADYTRYWYSMNPVPGDMNVAGGALDIYASGMIVAAFTL